MKPKHMMCFVHRGKATGLLLQIQFAYPSLVKLEMSDGNVATACLISKLFFPFSSQFKGGQNHQKRLPRLLTKKSE